MYKIMITVNITSLATQLKYCEKYFLCSLTYLSAHIIQHMACYSCDMGPRALPEMYARGHTFWQAQLPMLQLICNTY